MNRKVFLQLFLLIYIISIVSTQLDAQNRSFGIGFSLGIGIGSYEFFEEAVDNSKPLTYPSGGLHFTKRLDEKWALQYSPNVGLAGRSVEIDNGGGLGVSRLETRSAYLYQALHARYYLNQSFYISGGPEYGLLIWNRGRTFDNENVQLSSVDEASFFKRSNLLFSGSLGYSTKVQSSRKNAPVQIDALWFFEIRTRQGLSNILEDTPLFQDQISRLVTYEIATGFTFSSQN